MFFRTKEPSKTVETNAYDDNQQIINAINKSMAMVEFNTDGSIITANENFLKTTGYSLERDSRKASQYVLP